MASRLLTLLRLRTDPCSPCSSLYPAISGQQPIDDRARFARERDREVALWSMHAPALVVICLLLFVEEARASRFPLHRVRRFSSGPAFSSRPRPNRGGL